MAKCERFTTPKLKQKTREEMKRPRCVEELTSTGFTYVPYASKSAYFIDRKYDVS